MSSFSFFKLLVVWILVHQENGVLETLHINQRRTSIFQDELKNLIPVNANSFLEKEVLARVCITLKRTSTCDDQLQKSNAVNAKDFYFHFG